MTAAMMASLICRASSLQQFCHRDAEGAGQALENVEAGLLQSTRPVSRCESRWRIVGRSGGADHGEREAFADTSNSFSQNRNRNPPSQ